jgi:hypothetical protein
MSSRASSSGPYPSSVRSIARRPSQIAMQDYSYSSSCIKTAAGVPIVNGSDYVQSTSPPRSGLTNDDIKKESIGSSSLPIRPFDSAAYSFITSERFGPTSFSPPGHSLSPKQLSQHEKRGQFNALFTSNAVSGPSHTVPDVNVASTKSTRTSPAKQLTRSLLPTGISRNTERGLR